MSRNARSQKTASASGTAAADEIARFAALSDAWWDPEGQFAALHRLNPLRVAYVRKHLAAHFARSPDSLTPFTGLSVVDVGCGGGLLSEPLARLGAAVTAIDADRKSIAIARAHASQVSVDIAYRCAAPELLVREGARFEAVVTMEVIEHVAHMDAFLAAVSSLLQPGGALVLATINRTLKSLALAKVAAEYVLGWVPPGTHDWRKFVRPSELATGLRRTGLDLRDVSGMTYDPLANGWSLSRDLDVNYIAYATKL